MYLLELLYRAENWILTDIKYVERVLRVTIIERRDDIRKELVVLPLKQSEERTFTFKTY